MKQTSVEWYNTKLNAIDFKLNLGLINHEQCKVEMLEAFEQAKAMEKEQIEMAHTCGGYGEKEAEEYFSKTFKSE